MLVSSLSWAEECFKGSQIQINGKIISVEREALPELDPETGVFFKRCGEILSLEKTPVCFSTSSGLIDKFETKQIQLVLKDNSQKSKFEGLENEQVTLKVEEYYEGLTKTQFELLSLKRLSFRKRFG